MFHIEAIGRLRRIFSLRAQAPVSSINRNYGVLVYSHSGGLLDDDTPCKTISWAE